MAMSNGHRHGLVAHLSFLSQFVAFFAARAPLQWRQSTRYPHEILRGVVPGQVSGAAELNHPGEIAVRQTGEA